MVTSHLTQRGSSHRYLRCAKRLAQAIANSFFQDGFGVEPCVSKHLLRDFSDLQGRTASSVTCVFLEAE